jgi:hypothetical protein
LFKGVINAVAHRDYYLYAHTDEAHKPYIYSTSDHFTLVLPDLTYDNGVEDEMLPILNFEPVLGGTELDVKAFYYKTNRDMVNIE